MSHRRGVATVMITAVLGIAIVPAARADTGTFSNTTPIQIPTIGQGFPYPSEIQVTGLSGAITDVNATLVNMNHGFADDIEALMVAPGGQTTVLIADAGGTATVVNDTITLDDQAQLVAPDTGGFVGGLSYRPADYDLPGLEPYNPPAPPPPHGLTMSTSNGSNPNGTWSLFVFDDKFPDSGRIDGWSVNVTTTPAAGFPSATCGGRSVTIGGTAENDRLTGTPEADVISGGDGRDTIKGLKGKDIACGGKGKDALTGGKGKDRLLGQAGRDRLRGGGGKDVCKGGKGSDSASGCEVERSL
jgi:Ca2+-binding RTX toxin-like protein